MRITIKQLRRIIKEEVEAIDKKIDDIVNNNLDFLKNICEEYNGNMYVNMKLSDIVRDDFTPDDQVKYYNMFGDDFDIQDDFGKMTLKNLADKMSSEESEEIYDAYSQENEEGMKANW